MGAIQGTFTYDNETGNFNGQYSKSGSLANLGRYQLNGTFSGQFKSNLELIGVISITQKSLDYGITEYNSANMLGQK
jgi:hypothetical protein